MTNSITITGNLASEIELRWTPSGHPVASGKLADTPRRKNPATGEWEDAGETLWVEFSVWDAEAEALAERAQGYRGRVTVTGTLGQRTYEHQGQQRAQLTLRADSVALRAPREKPSWTRDAARARGATYMDRDPWATPATGEAPF